MRAGTRLGKYRLVAELGHGGMADVYLAIVEGPTGTGFAKLAVVKRLRPTYAEDPDFVAMLMDEARITSRLHHPNVVQLFEVDHDNGEYFLAIEFLDGQPLHRIVKRAARDGKPLSEASHLVVILDALRGLHYAHELADYDGTPLGVVHRDMTPHNLFVTYDGHVKVMDFGVAKAAGRSVETREGVVKGKIRYMPAEQALGRGVDRRTDIFSVGIMLWQALTGVGFWRDVDDLAIFTHLSQGSYEASPRAVRRDVPEVLDRICRKALAQRPEDRYATAEEMAAEIESYLGAAVVQGRRELASSMRALFDKEARRLRKVLEGLGKFRSEVTVSSQSTDSPSTVSTVVMAAVPASPRPSAAPPPRPVTPESIAPMAMQHEEGVPGWVPPEPRERKQLYRAWLAVGATLLSLAVGLVATERPESPPHARRAAVAVPEVSPIVVGGGARAAREASVDGLARIVIVREIEAAPETPTATSATEAPPPPPVPPAAPSARAKDRGKLSLDGDDPWGQKGSEPR